MATELAIKKSVNPVLSTDYLQALSDVGTEEQRMMASEILRNREIIEQFKVKNMNLMMKVRNLERNAPTESIGKTKAYSDEVELKVPTRRSNNGLKEPVRISRSQPENPGETYQTWKREMGKTSNVKTLEKVAEEYTKKITDDHPWI